MPSDANPGLTSNHPTKPSRAHAKAATGLDPRALLAALRRHWLLAGVLSVLAAGSAGAAVWFFLPPGNHTFTRVLHIAAMPHVVAFEQNQRADFNTFKQTQVALLRSRKVLTAALRSPKVANSDWLKQTADPLVWLEKEVKITFPSSPEIMNVSLAGKADQVPNLTALVDAVSDAYLSEIVDKDHQRLLKQLDLLREIAGRYEKKVKAIRLSMKKLREQAGTGSTATLVLKQNMAVKELDGAVQDLARHRGEMRSLRSQIESQSKGKAADEGDPLKEELQVALDQDEQLGKLKASAKELQDLIDRDAARSPKGYDAPVLEPHLRQQKKLTAEIKQREDAVKKTATAQLKKEWKKIGDLGLPAMKQRLSYLEDYEKFLAKDCERLSREAKQMNLTALDLEDFNHDLAEADGMRATLVKRAEMLSIEAEAPPRIYRLDDEVVVTAPNEQMRKLRFCGMAAAGAVGLVLLGVCLLEARTQRVTSPTDVAKSLGLTVVGVLPFYRGNRGGARAAQRLKESVDDARTMLLHQAETGNLKAVLVTSAVSGEGKTSLACHLAASLARAGRRTLLIDADLRKPDAHNIFGKPNSPGLCEVFRGETPLGEAVQAAGLPGLRLLPAGRSDDRALRAIAQTGFATVLAQLRQECDFIVIDSSPVLEVPDALMLGRHADGVLFAVMQGETRTHRLASAAGRFARLDAPILGMIVNGAVEADQSAYGPYTHPLPGLTTATTPNRKDAGR